MAAKPALKPARLSDPNAELLEAVTIGGRRWADTAMKSPEEARRALNRLGILTPTGRLSKNYK